MDRITQHGTQDSKFSRAGKPTGQINCVDGFRLSVQAGGGAYSVPRHHGFSAHDPGSDFEGPYTHAEVGFPSQQPQPWSKWEKYCEAPSEPTETVYGYVPVELIRALIESHGGEVK